MTRGLSFLAKASTATAPSTHVVIVLPRLFVAAALGLAATMLPSAAQDRSRVVDCKLAVDGQEYISGPCRFTPIGNDGSFQIMARDGRYFAQLNVDRPGAGAGYWNEDPEATHAQSSLGELVSKDGCWTNSRASVCAW